MLTGTLSIRDLFDKNVHHLVPLFQRPYVWQEEDQWEPLWEDVRRLAEALVAGKPARAHFLGASVHEKKDVPPGQMETRLVIDGQQRLTTLQLLLQAFADVVAERGLDSWRQALHNLTRNNHPPRQRPQQDFKLWPTNADRDDFRRTMEAGSPALLCVSYGAKSGAENVGRQIPDAYLYFARVIEDWLGNGRHEARVAALYGGLYENVRLVVIDLDEKDDAQLIFETLNARGTPLLASDLVKNALLQEVVADNGDPEDLYQQYWQPFDRAAGFWRQEIGRGHARRPRIDGFLQNYLTLRMKDEVPAGHLYTAYRDFADGPSAGTARHRLAELAQYASIYRRLDSAHEAPRVQLFLERLRTMDIGTAYPFLLELFARIETDPDRLVVVLEDVESFLVRRMVCRLSTRGYNRLFVELLNVLDGDAAGIPDHVREKLANGTAEFDRWPSDTEFREAWVGAPLYEVLTRPRLRLLLEGMERRLRDKLAETDYVPKNLTVEHIMPQSWEANWPLPHSESVETTRENRIRLLHTVGNLTLLNNSLNPLVSNGPWAGMNGGVGKRKAIAEHSVLHLNHRLCDSAEWTEAEIRARSQELFAIAQSVWPQPSFPATSEASP